MHEDVTAVVAGDKAEALVGVVPLDLAGRHGEALRKLMRMEVGEVEPASLPVATTRVVTNSSERHQANGSGRRRPGCSTRLDHVLGSRLSVRCPTLITMSDDTGPDYPPPAFPNPPGVPDAPTYSAYQPPAVPPRTSRRRSPRPTTSATSCRAAAHRRPETCSTSGHIERAQRPRDRAQPGRRSGRHRCRCRLRQSRPQKVSSAGQPEHWAPANSIAFVKVDLDPANGDKTAALKFEQTFPDAPKVTDRRPERRPARRGVQDTGQSDQTSTTRPTSSRGSATSAAVAVFPTPSSKIQSVGILQVTDPAAAKAGLAKLASQPGSESAEPASPLRATTPSSATARRSSTRPLPVRSTSRHRHATPPTPPTSRRLKATAS